MEKKQESKNCNSNLYIYQTPSSAIFFTNSHYYNIIIIFSTWHAVNLLVQKIVLFASIFQNKFKKQCFSRFLPFSLNSDHLFDQALPRRACRAYSIYSVRASIRSTNLRAVELSGTVSLSLSVRNRVWICSRGNRPAASSTFVADKGLAF